LLRLHQSYQLYRGLSKDGGGSKNHFTPF